MGSSCCTTRDEKVVPEGSTTVAESLATSNRLEIKKENAGSYRNSNFLQDEITMVNS